jgi:hypothetical protein
MNSPERVQKAHCKWSSFVLILTILYGLCFSLNMVYRLRAAFTISMSFLSICHFISSLGNVNDHRLKEKERFAKMAQDKVDKAAKKSKAQGEKLSKESKKVYKEDKKNKNLRNRASEAAEHKKET